MPKTFQRPDPPADDSFQQWVRPTYEAWDDEAEADVAEATSWGDADHGPEPRPDWVVTSLDAIDTDLGVLKTGKEAVCHLVHRGVPGGEGFLAVAKRYRRTGGFTRDATYREGRKVKASREQRALERRTALGRAIAASEWARAEFAVLGRLWSVGVSVPYPVQLCGQEILMEHLGDDDRSAPRLVDARLKGARLAAMVDRLVDDLRRMTAEGLVHGDLSAFNLLVWDERIWIIDVPQAVDIAANPHALDLLHRDLVNLATWCARRGVDLDADELFADLMIEVPGWGPR